MNKLIAIALILSISTLSVRAVTAGNPCSSTCTGATAANGQTCTASSSVIVFTISFDSFKVNDNVDSSLGTEQYEDCKSEVRNNALDLLHQKQKKLFITTILGADFYLSKTLQKVDIGYEDNYAVLNRTKYLTTDCILIGAKVQIRKPAHYHAYPLSSLFLQKISL
ncbi:hypothetical protein ABPG74_022778 [Tetrahymena malaccensis]